MALSTIKTASIANDAITSDKIINDGNLGVRNLIHNGSLQVWQRGTSLSITTSNYRIADGWINFPGTGGGGTASQQTFTVGQTDVPGEPDYYLRHDQSTGASSEPNIQTRIEGVRTGAGQSVTLSFYARVSSGTLTIDPIIRQNFGSGGSAYVDNTPTDITVTTSWQRFTRTITLASISGKTIGSNDQLQIRLQLPTSTTFTLDIASAQFEIGSVATPFEHRSYGDELARCQRYYYFHGQGTGSNSGDIAIGSYYDSVSLDAIVQFPVTMRATPTVDATSGTNYYVSFRNSGADYFNSFIINKGSPSAAAIGNSSQASGTGGQATLVRYNSASARVAFDSDL